MPAPTATDLLPSPVLVSDAERDALLAVARAAIVRAVGADGSLAPAPAPRAPAGGGEPRRGAAFVTLFAHGDLRGCIGLLDPARPLEDSVAEAAVAAATRDPRFHAVRADELSSIELHVSVLGAFVPLGDPRDFRLGVDGILVERDWARGLLLPEVAVEHALDHVGMLRIACTKAGLSRDAWMDARTTVSAFETASFGGPAIAPARADDEDDPLES